jgi:hypothetical protein
VKRLVPLVLFGSLCGATLVAAPQRPNYPPPPPPLNSGEAPRVPIISKRLDLDLLQREADALANTAQTIPGDVANVRKGLLPKDIIQKLKQIEKLSKRLRSELNP